MADSSQYTSQLRTVPTSLLPSRMDGDLLDQLSQRREVPHALYVSSHELQKYDPSLLSSIQDFRAYALELNVLK